MVINDVTLETLLHQTGSLRSAWAKYKEFGGKCAWDTFRKKANGYLSKKESPSWEPKEQVSPEKIGVAIYDIHFPHESEDVLRAITNYVKAKYSHVDYLILGGDILDCAAISKFGTDPYDTKPIHEEIQHAKARLQELVKDIGAEKSYYIKGNHEDRLERYLQSRAPEISRLEGLTIPDQLGLSKMGVEWIDNIKRKADGQDFFKIGRLFFGHGHEFSICPLVAPARRYFMKTFSNLMVGHIHRVDEHFERDLSNNLIGSWTCGCACDLNPTYRVQNSWVQGFAIIKWFPGGLFQVSLKKIIEGKVL